MNVEKFVRYGALVEQLPEAWEIIMTHMDEFHNRPYVEIKPTLNPDGVGWYEVQISGVVYD